MKKKIEKKRNKKKINDDDDNYIDDGKDDEIDYDIEYEYEKKKESEESEESEDDELENKIIKKNIILILENNKRKYDSDNDIKEEKNIKNGLKKYKNIINKYSFEEKKYFDNLNEKDRQEIYMKEMKINNNLNIKDNIPNRFKLLNYNIPDIVKSTIISYIEQLNMMCPSSSEYFKLNNWITILSKIPMGNYSKINIQGHDDVSSYLINMKKNIDDNIYGHIETKEQIIRIMAQWISNTDKTGYVIGIKGPPGVGKTKLVKECICKAMNFPLAFISLGGIDDASYLSGFNYTYEGSRYGKILECLIKAGVMNPVFLFDELDKVSATSRGDEIINTLIHLTDPIQNEKFTDKYFQEIDLDISKSIIIFTYNNEEYINPILKDRMITINVNGYTSKEKLIIVKNYLLDEILPKYNFKKGDIIMDDNLIEYIILLTSKNESGVRGLKRAINDLVSWINMMKYIKTDNIEIILPYKVTIDFYNKYCIRNNKTSREGELISSMYL